jgi:hypothetical protein
LQKFKGCVRIISITSFISYSDDFVTLLGCYLLFSDDDDDDNNNEDDGDDECGTGDHYMTYPFVGRLFYIFILGFNSFDCLMIGG